MVMIEAKARKWGNSIGFVIPKKVAEKEKLKDGDKIEILILPRENTAIKMFGSLKGKLKRSTQEILDETDRELYGK